MSNRYAPLPNPRSDRDANEEMEAAFDASDDEEDDHASETQPLNPTPPTPSAIRVPGTYDFENVDYDYPPPGSPPSPSARALPNDYGNSNGLVPSFNDSSRPGAKQSWLSRTAAAILPARYAQRFGLNSAPAVIGNNNDGVFANVTAKPTRPIRVQDGDETYIVPEDTRAEAPPSYASAQSDAVPPYWEANTVHAPFSPDSIGEMIIDSLPTGSLFSFLWNMLVSISFQFVGFLLTYLLHTTHAARLGSRAGLGVTLIQYGFALRGRVESNNDGENASLWSGWRTSAPQPTFATAAEADAYWKHQGNSTMMGGMTSPPTLTDEEASALVADATTEWLSFFLMTIGWFILLTSILGFWRVKRWERGVFTSQQNNPNSAPGQQARDPAFVSQFERTFGLRGISRTDLFRQGFGFGRRSQENQESDEAVLAEEGQADVIFEPDERDLMIPIDPSNPDRERLIEEALRNERRLHNDLRAAGLL